MAQTRANIHQHITEQASFPMNDNSVSNDNHSIPTDLPPFDKQKMLAMQAQVSQGRLQPNIVSPHSMDKTKAKAPTGPVKRQVAEAWNNEKRKRNYEAPKPLIEEQHEDNKTPGTCQCCEHCGRLCLQEDCLMTVEARQHYHLDIKRELSTQDPVLEGAAQEEDSTWIINFED